MRHQELDEETTSHIFVAVKYVSGCCKDVKEACEWFWVLLCVQDGRYVLQVTKIYV